MFSIRFCAYVSLCQVSRRFTKFSKVFFRNLVSAIIALYLIIKNKGSMTGKKENRKLLFMRSLFGTLGVILNFYAIDKLVLSDANMLNKISPFLVVIFSAIFLKEKINKNQIISIVIAFTGALFIIKPTFSVEIIPYMGGLMSAVFAASAYTCLRAIGNKEEAHTIVFFFSMFSLISILPMFIYVYEPMTFKQLLCMILAGVFASLGQFGVTLAYRYAPAKEISIFDYSNIIFSAILSIFIFNQYPDLFSIIGYIIVFTASYYVFLYNKKLDKIESKKDTSSESV